MTEFELIYRYFKQQEDQADISIAKGLGDDAAVVQLQQNSQWVTCVDTLVQGRHFSDDWQEVSKLAFAIGYKAVAVNVSDIAAMGAVPHSLLLALALPQRLANDSWISEFAQGLFHACSQFGVRLIGGDTTRHDKLVISVTANGVIDTPNQKPVYRSGAHIGDKVYVSGTVGDACYALYHPHNEVGQQLAHRLHMPTPRISLGEALGRQGLVTAMIDVSDGLAQDLSHICQQSGVAIRLDLEQLPTSAGLKNIELSERLLCQLTGGDDYELAFTLPANVSVPSGHTNVTCIGEVVHREGATAASSIHTSNIKDDRLNSREYSPFILSYQGSPITKDNPYPFKAYPNLSGYQHFSKE